MTRTILPNPSSQGTTHIGDSSYNNARDNYEVGFFAEQMACYKAPYIKYPMLAGIRTDVYFDNLLYGNYRRFLGAYSEQTGISVHKDSFSIVLSDESALTDLKLSFIKTATAEPDHVTVPVQIVKTATGKNAQPSVLLLGDSMTDQGKYQKYCNDLLVGNDISVNWLGSRISSFGLNHEGRAGWRAYTYTHLAASTGADGEGRAAKNAFWNPAANAFDFRYYMDCQGYKNVDIVLIALGSNDFAKDNHTTVEEVAAAWQKIIDSIHAFNPNIKIVLWLCPMPCIMLGVSLAVKQTFDMHKIILDNYMNNQWGKNNIWILPSYLALDPVYGFPYVAVSRNQYDPAITIEPTDTIHPSVSGYHQLANPIAAMIQYLAASKQ